MFKKINGEIPDVDVNLSGCNYYQRVELMM